jgi:hypothetical protein
MGNPFYVPIVKVLSLRKMMKRRSMTMKMKKRQQMEQRLRRRFRLSQVHKDNMA